MRASLCLCMLVILGQGFESAAQQTATREPGVIVRLYDIGVGVHAIPELVPDQLPNVVKTLSTLKLTADEFAPLQDRFLTEVIGDLEVERAGRYEFRLISDDGARLWIDGKLVIDHDGLHGAEPKDGRTRLEVGWHAIRILHFESGGGEHLELRWKPAGSPENADFVLIPAAALTHGNDVSRETSPGTKKIIPPLRRGRPGDGTPVAGIHPGYRRGPAEDAERGESQTTSHLWLRVAAIGAEMPEQPPFAWLPPEPVGFDLTSTKAFGRQYLVGNAATGCLRRISGDILDRDLPQGCVFRFSRGHLRGFNNTILYKDGRILLMVVDKSLDELQVLAQDEAAVKKLWREMEKELLAPTGRVPFEIHAVRAMGNGFEIEFTKPLDVRCGWEADSYYVEQWPFTLKSQISNAATPSAPRRDAVRYPVKSASVSADRKRVFLEIENLEASHVVYIRLLPPCVSEDGELPWSTEAWYTLNAIPQNRFGKVLSPPVKEPQNFLTAEEKAAGWTLLFDGKTTGGWRGYKKDDFPDGWSVVDGSLVRVGPGGGDICTVEQFDNFELKLEWRICAAGNSGIFYRVDEKYGWPWESGPEIQVLDNAEHVDGRNPKTSAGSNYALHAPAKDVTEPVGFFNKVRIVAEGPHIEHWLNGVKVVEYELGSDEWKEIVAGSKFAAWPNYGRVPQGRIVLQDHGDRVWYRNIKIRRLGTD